MDIAMKAGLIVFAIMIVVIAAAMRGKPVGCDCETCPCRQKEIMK